MEKCEKIPEKEWKNVKSYIGKYVRTRWGHIGKIIDTTRIFEVGTMVQGSNEADYDIIPSKDGYLDAYVMNTYYGCDDEHDVIEDDDIKLIGDTLTKVIEYGDIVNNCMVISVGATTFGANDEPLDYRVNILTGGSSRWLDDKNIKTVVCHEFMEKGTYENEKTSE